MRLSIIIPVYNSEKHLTRCLKSICNQDVAKDQYEVVVINDGSTDHSLKIAQSFQDKIANLYIITHKNQGEAVSRNAALKLAKGDYVTFLDSDDYYEEDCLKNALAVVDHNDLDILYLRLRQVDESGRFLRYIADLGLEGQVISGLQHGRRPFPATVYRREIIGDLRFPLGIIVGPDSVFNALVQSKAQKVSFTKAAVYNYTYRTDSLSKQGYSEKAYHGFMKAIKELRNFEQLHFVNDETARLFFEKIYTVFVTRIIELSIMPSWDMQRYDHLLTLLSEEKLLYILDSMAEKYRFINTSFVKFKSWQKYLNFKTQIYELLHRA